MTDTKPGSASTEWKVVVLNYIVGVLLLGAALWMQNNGQDTTTIMAMAIGFLGVNGLSYGAMRTVHKNKVAETSEVKS
jgi:NO-binding membrane sensor protein with MHYT domain